jgi:regulator of protease activity HflC (stomatin/prohibitin superfamily)
METITRFIRNRIKDAAGSGLLLFALILILMMSQSCTTIRPGELGLKVVRGKLQPANYAQGRHHLGFGVHYVKFNMRITELSTKMTLPTKEGLEAKTDITLLYHIKPEAIHDIYQVLGLNYESAIIKNNFEATARETCLNYKAMDLMVQRDSLEKLIFDNMNLDIGHYGFVMDQVLVRDIDVPDTIDRAIEKKVFLEQQAKQQVVDNQIQKIITQASIEKQRQEMEFNFEKDKRTKEAGIEQERMQIDFAIEKQKKESERIILEAQTTAKVQELLKPSITPLLIQYKSIDAMKALAASPNTKIFITDGKTPLALRDETK